MPGTYAIPEELDVKTAAGKKTAAFLDGLKTSDAAYKLLNRLIAAAKKCDALYANLAGEIAMSVKDAAGVTSALKDIADELEHFSDLKSAAEALEDFVKKIPQAPEQKKVLDALKKALKEIADTSDEKAKLLIAARSPLAEMRIQWNEADRITVMDVVSTPELKKLYVKYCNKELSIENLEYLDNFQSSKVPTTLAQATRVGIDRLNFSSSVMGEIRASIEFIQTDLGIGKDEQIRSRLDLLSEEDIGMKPSELWKDWDKLWNRAYNEIYSLSSDTVNRFKRSPDVVRALAKIKG